MPHLDYQKRDGIAYLVMNRPERRNALSPQMIVEMAAAWQDFRDDREARVAILTGAGDRAFCAGADLGLLIPLLSGARKPEDEHDEALLADRSLMQKALLRDFELYKPVIAAVNGFALAGGTEILQATDLRIAAEHAEFGLSEVMRGIIPAGGSLVRLARQIPYCKAMQILLTGDRMSAEEAYRIGLINEVAPAAEVLGRAEALAARIAENGPLAVAACKEAVTRTSGLPLNDAFRIENELAGRVMRSKDAIEGPRAFMEKRKPEFRGE
ncbi:MAG: enoyl-CoA hydratase [Gammaproteobacteria bacterium]|nr:enoyl-CoA hydratase [Gammaproteobacteria bacterium]MBK81781.1 enoyl-CoA hydratase [Gammaproteobacteria bacterium]|tara:strand:+ start:3771 stop:4577 length:807 start_codon:yes stop_codon:yes gene_type:complete